MGAGIVGQGADVFGGGVADDFAAGADDVAGAGVAMARAVRTSTACPSASWPIAFGEAVYCRFSGSRIALSMGTSSGRDLVTVVHTMSRSISKYAWMRRLRVLTTHRHGISGLAARVSVLTRLAASPRTSHARSSARRSWVSVSRSPRSRHWTKDIAYKVASSMCRMRFRSESSSILDQRGSHHFVAEVAAQVPGRSHVGLAAKDLGEFFFHCRDVKPIFYSYKT